MSHEKNSCCSAEAQAAGCCGAPASRASVWGAALAVIVVVALAAGFLDWRAQVRQWAPYGDEQTARNAFMVQSIQYSTLNEQVAKDPKFFDKFRDQVKAQAGGQGQQAQGQEAAAPEIKKATDGQAKALKAGAYVDGAADARFTVYEFSDLECPFCKRQQDQGTIEAVKAKFPGEVNRVFKASPLPFHPQAHIAATAILCAGEIGGAEAYYKGIAETFAQGDARTGQFDESVPAGLGKTLKLDAKKFDACYKGDKFKDAIAATIAQGAALGVQGTPGNVIFDNQTGNYVLLAGAYPAEQFVAAVEQLKAAK